MKIKDLFMFDKLKIKNVDYLDTEEFLHNFLKQLEDVEFIKDEYDGMYQVYEYKTLDDKYKTITQYNDYCFIGDISNSNLTLDCYEEGKYIDIHLYNKKEEK